MGLLPISSGAQSHSSSNPSATPAFDLLDKSGVHLHQLFDQVFDQYLLVNNKQKNRWKKAVRQQIEIHKDYLNLNILMLLALEGDRRLQAESGLPFMNTRYESDPNQLTADDILGQAIATLINGESGATDYRVMQQLIGNNAILTSHRPMVKQMLLGFIGGIVSIVNPQTQIIRITQIIDYGPAHRTRETRFCYLPLGHSQQQLLVATAKVSFRFYKKHGRMIDGINGVKSNGQLGHYWLSNINQLHRFNLSAAAYPLANDDVIHWFYGADLSDEPTK